VTNIYIPEYLEHLQVSEEILPFVQATPRLLPGETDDDYYRLFELLATEVLPETPVQWLWAIDLAWLWFDVSRYRRWMNAILSTTGGAAPAGGMVGSMAKFLGMFPVMDGPDVLIEDDIGDRKWSGLNC
jgi:hypothetical protein